MATGQKSSFTFGTSGYTWPIVTIDPPSESVEVIEEPNLNLDLGAYMPKSPGDIVDGGRYTLTVDADDDAVIPPRAAQTMTWTKPDGTTWVFPGFISEVKESSYQTSQRKLTDITVEVAGTVVKTPAP